MLYIATHEQTDVTRGLRSGLRGALVFSETDSLCNSYAVVAQDSATAMRVAFDRGVQTRCVTLDGDDFNPGGTLTGGSRAAGGSLLARLAERTAEEAVLASHRAALEAAKKALRDMAAAAKQHATCALCGLLSIY